jgi:hypothetical protein
MLMLEGTDEGFVGSGINYRLETMKEGMPEGMDAGDAIAKIGDV